MNVLAILKDFTFRCKSVFENTTTKMSKRWLKPKARCMDLAESVKFVA